jgi:cell cycle arrest protein BUB2
MPTALFERVEKAQELPELLEGFRRAAVNGLTSPEERCQIWRLCLGIIAPVSVEAYQIRVSRGKSEVYDKIKKDTTRTFKNDTEYHAKVSEAALIRVLNALAHEQVDKNTVSPYVQGMNVIAGMLLYVMPSEAEAYECFSAFVTMFSPRYYQPMLDGVHVGLQVRCLAA